VLTLDVDEIQIPHLGDLGAECHRFLEVEVGVEEQHGQMGMDLLQHVEDHETRRLERGRDRQWIDRLRCPPQDLLR
jgi:hypothetical protein